MTAPRVAVVIQNETSSSNIPSATRLRAWARAAVATAAAGEITVRLVDEAESAELNRRFRGRMGATNVLAFAAEATLPMDAAELPPIGDVVVCAPLVLREAAEQGRALEAHWAHIVIHGCLHLVGYDHQDDAQARLMESRERALLARFGFPDPYG